VSKAKVADGVKVAIEVVGAKVTVPVTEAPPVAVKVNVEELMVDAFID
jgi:hypothetical protein